MRKVAIVMLFLVTACLNTKKQLKIMEFTVTSDTVINNESIGKWFIVIDQIIPEEEFSIGTKKMASTYFCYSEELKDTFIIINPEGKTKYKDMMPIKLYKTKKTSVGERINYYLSKEMLKKEYPIILAKAIYPEY